MYVQTAYLILHSLRYTSFFRPCCFFLHTAWTLLHYVFFKSFLFECPAVSFSVWLRLSLTLCLFDCPFANPRACCLGTGKTESVKALGTALGRYTLVFNCDETFDFNAMGRLFAGLCQVGAWGCFDEFNRLDEKILSAVSEQILTIQVRRKVKRRAVLSLPIHSFFSSY